MEGAITNFRLIAFVCHHLDFFLSSGNNHPAVDVRGPSRKFGLHIKARNFALCLLSMTASAAQVQRWMCG